MTIWYALECSISPTRTLGVRDDLIAKGFEAFTPTETLWKRDKARKRVKATIAAMPGYVFLGFAGSVRWSTVLEVDHVWDVMRYQTGGQPATIPDRVMRRVINMSADELNEHSRKIREGGTAEIKGGAFNGHMVDIKKINGDRARVVFHVILTGIREMNVPIDELEVV